MSYRPFSKDLWDYLDDIPYMPSRRDRDALVASGETRRVRIWDYFFRIQPEDVGKPQKKEIELVRIDLEIEFRKNREQMEVLQGDLDHLERKLSARLRRALTFGVISFLVGSIVGAFLYLRPGPDSVMLYCSAPFGVIGVFLLGIALLTWWNRITERRSVQRQIDAIGELQKRQVKATRNRISALEEEIENLKRQIPKPPGDEQVRAWLNEDLSGLGKRCIQQTGLGDQLTPISKLNKNSGGAITNNPIPVMGPGELQNSDNIPRSFRRDENPDLNKHLIARRAYVIPGEQFVDVLYGVYYIKYLILSDDLMATYAFYYDFVNGKQYAERETEQYYRDIVVISTTKESRQVILGADNDEYILVEDAPTFTLSLPSSETRKVTFVNEEYFQGIRDKLGLTPEQVRQIFWIKDAEQTVENTSLVLRYLVRQYKT